MEAKRVKLEVPAEENPTTSTTTSNNDDALAFSSSQLQYDDYHESSVLSLIARHLAERGLLASAAALTREAHEVLDIEVSPYPFQGSLSDLEKEILENKWDVVLSKIGLARLSEETSFALVEHVACWLARTDRAACTEFVSGATAFSRLKKVNLKRYETIHAYLQQPKGPASFLIPIAALTRRLVEEGQRLDTSAPSRENRLVELLRDALKWRDVSCELSRLTSTSSDEWMLKGPVFSTGAPPPSSGALVEHAHSSAWSLSCTTKRSVKGSARLESMALSPNGRVLATGDDEGFVQLVRLLDDGRGLRFHDEASLLVAGEASVLSLSFSQDSTTLLTGDSEGCVTMFGSLDSSQPSTRTFARVHDGAVLCVSASPDGERCVSGGVDRVVRVLGVQGGTVLSELRGHESFVDACAWARTTKKSFVVLSGGSDGTMRVWEPSTGRCLRTVEVFAGSTSLRVNRLVPFVMRSEDEGVSPLQGQPCSWLGSQPHNAVLVPCAGAGWAVVEWSTGKRVVRHESAETVDAHPSRDGRSIFEITKSGHVFVTSLGSSGARSRLDLRPSLPPAFAANDKGGGASLGFGILPNAPNGFGVLYSGGAVVYEASR